MSPLRSIKSRGVILLEEEKEKEYFRGLAAVLGAQCDNKERQRRKKKKKKKKKRKNQGRDDREEERGRVGRRWSVKKGGEGYKEGSFVIAKLTLRL